MTDNTCNICAETYNKTVHAPVSCLFCAYHACRKCCETFLVTVPEPQCMNPTCNKQWTRKFLSENMTKSFMNKGYKEYREKVFFDREQALLPATQIVVERMKERIRIQRLIDVVDAEYGLALREWEKQCSVFVNRKNVLQRELYAEARRAAASDQGPRPLGQGPLGEGQSQEERRRFIRRCGNSAADCRGFLSQQWKCGMCDTYTCNKCHELKLEEHTCRPEDVQTVELKARDTKPCPKCGVEITKLEGCDQMFCTNCNTGFSWNRGTIQTNVHNPHYFEWLRRTGGQEAEAQGPACGEMLQTRLVPIGLRMYDEAIYTRFTDILQSALHIQGVNIHAFVVDDVLNNEDLRVKYMLNEIDEAVFKTLLQRQQKKFEKSREVHGILTMYLRSVADILFRCRAVYNSDRTAATCKKEMMDTLDEVPRLIEYVNECFADVSKIFGCVQWSVNVLESSRNARDFFRNVLKGAATEAADA